MAYCPAVKPNDAPRGPVVLGGTVRSCSPNLVVERLMAARTGSELAGTSADRHAREDAAIKNQAASGLGVNTASSCNGSKRRSVVPSASGAAA
jgi:hypothetical protein